MLLWALMKHKRVKLIILRAFMVLVALAAAAFVAYKFGLFDFMKPKIIATTEQQLTTAKDKLVQLTNQVGPTPSSGTLSKTQAELAQLIKDTTSVETKQIYLYKSFDLYVNSGDYKQALIVANQAELIKPTALSAGSIAYAYNGLKDYKKAVQYYQLAADRSTRVDNPNVRCPYNDYMTSKRLAEALIK